MNLSLCITTYNRYEMTIESFAKVLDDPRIDDIVISDDCSTDGSFNKLLTHACRDTTKKINFYSRVGNVGMSRNKRDAISMAKNEWCIILDSDNIIGPDYLDAFFSYVGESGPVSDGSIFCPDFARPKFDYRAYSMPKAPIFHRYNIQKFIANDDFNCLMNTCNYIVNRDFYLTTYKHNPEHIASDTIWHNYNHLKAGGGFHVVPGMQYYHRVHAGSGFMQGVEHNMAKAAEVRKLIQQL